ELGTSRELGLVDPGEPLLHPVLVEPGLARHLGIDRVGYGLDELREETIELALARELVEHVLHRLPEVLDVALGAAALAPRARDLLVEREVPARVPLAA